MIKSYMHLFPRISQLLERNHYVPYGVAQAIIILITLIAGQFALSYDEELQREKASLINLTTKRATIITTINDYRIGYYTNYREKSLESYDDIYDGEIAASIVLKNFPLASYNTLSSLAKELKIKLSGEYGSQKNSEILKRQYQYDGTNLLQFQFKGDFLINLTEGYIYLSGIKNLSHEIYRQEIRTIIYQGSGVYQFVLGSSASRTFSFYLYELGDNHFKIEVDGIMSVYDDEYIRISSKDPQELDFFVNSYVPKLNESSAPLRNSFTNISEKALYNDMYDDSIAQLGKIFDRNFFAHISSSIEVAPLLYHLLVALKVLTPYQLAHYQVNDEDYSIVLSNSQTNLRRVLPYIHNYGRQFYLSDEFLQMLIIHHNDANASTKDLLANRTSLAFGSYPLEEDFAEAIEQGAFLIVEPIFYDSMVFVVNKNNPVSDISAENLDAVLGRNLTNWRDLGGYDRLIKNHHYNLDDFSNRVLHEFFPDTHTNEDHYIKNDLYNKEIMLSFFTQPQSLGFLGFTFGSIARSFEYADEIKVLSIDGVYPFENEELNPDYIYKEPLYAIYLSNAPQEVISFITFLRTNPYIDELVAKLGYFKD